MFISQSCIDEHELGLARSVFKGNADFPVASFKSFKRRMYQIQQMCIFEDEEAKRYGYLKHKMMKTHDKVNREPIGLKARSEKDEKKRSASIDLGGICANKNYSEGSLYRAELMLKLRICKIERPTVFTNSTKRRSSVFF